MRVSVLAIGAGLVASATAASSSKAPACVNKCWEYTKYVSTCDQDTACLCEDAEYQNAVYQCLYSQCPTAYFANALHHTLAICSQSETDAPALIRQEGLKAKRQDPPSYGGSVQPAPPAYSSAAPPAYSSAAPPSYMTGSAMPPAVTSARGSPGASVPATRTYNTRASPNASGSAAPTYASSRANPGNPAPTGGEGGAPAPAPTFTGAAVANAPFGVLAAAGVAALAALA